MGHFVISIPIGGAVPKLWHGPSDHGVDEAYQVSFRLYQSLAEITALRLQFGSTLAFHNIIITF